MAPDWSTLITVFLGGGLVVALYQSLASAKLRRLHSQQTTRAKLLMIKVYVAGARASASHQQLQVQWSHQCAALFGEATYEAGEMGRGGPDLGELSNLLAGWLSQAPFVAFGIEEERKRKVIDLCSHLVRLEQCLERLVEAIPRG
jgi:hypothetical protein